jgi:hypothetical protein
MPVSPSGANFPYYYKGGELSGLHLESYSSDEDGVIAMMKAEQEFFIKQNRKMSLWINFYGTNLTDRVLGEFVEYILHINHRVSKLGIVGCSFRGKWKLNKLIGKAEQLSTLPIKYFANPEEAKTWLVSESD